MEQEKIKEQDIEYLQDAVNFYSKHAIENLNQKNITSRTREKYEDIRKMGSIVYPKLSKLCAAPTPPSVAPTEEKDKEEILLRHCKANEHHGDKTPDLFTRFLIYNAMDEYAAASIEGSDYDMQRIYSWIMDENRQPAQTFFTSGNLRNVAKEIEFRLNREGWVKVEEVIAFTDWASCNYAPQNLRGQQYWKPKGWVTDNVLSTEEIFNIFKTSK